MSAEEKDLRLVLDAQSRQSRSGNIVGDLVTEMKSSLLSEYNWEELVQPAPTALSCMGACLVASASLNADIDLRPVQGKGFQYLKYSSVRPSLVEASNMGRMAFLTAEKGMDNIQLSSKLIYEKLNDVMDCLGDPRGASRMLRPILSNIQNGSDRCFQAALDTDNKFDEWLSYVAELHSACSSIQNGAVVTVPDANVSAVVEQARLDNSNSGADATTKTLELLGKQASMITEVFKKTVDEFPVGWEIISRQLVSDLVSSSTARLNQAIPILLESMSPLKKVAATDKSTQRPQPLPAAPGFTQQALDPAYSEVLKINTYLAMMNIMIRGKEGDIDWEATQGQNGAKSGMKFLSTMLGVCKTHFDSVATASEPSTTLKSVYQSICQVASEIAAEVENASSRPAKGSDKINKWLSEFAGAYQKATTLISASRSLLGSAASEIPLFGSEGAIEPPGNSAKKAPSRTVIESAKKRFTETQQVLTNTQANYSKTTQMLNSEKDKLAEIQASLSKLTESNVTLTQVKEILIQNIRLIVSLKQQNNNLVRFFKAINAVLGSCQQLYVSPLVERIKNGSGDQNDKIRIGDLTLLTLQSSQLFSTAITLRAYFNVYGDIARFWAELSRQNMQPGLIMADELSVSTDDPNRLKRKAKDLANWCQSATSNIFEVAGQKQRQTSDGMDSRISSAKDTMSNLSPLPDSTREAIAAGTGSMKAAVEAGIEARKAASTILRSLDG